MLDSRNRKIQLSVEVYIAEYKIASYWVVFCVAVVTVAMVTVAMVTVVMVAHFRTLPSVTQHSLRPTSLPSR